MELIIKEVIRIGSYTMHKVSRKENGFPTSRPDINNMLQSEVEVEGRKYRICRIEIKPIPGGNEIDDQVALHLLEVKL